MLWAFRALRGAQLRALVACVRSRSRIANVFRSLEPLHTLVALLFWASFALWVSRIFWIHQQRALILPMNVHFVLLMFLIVSAFNAEKTLRREMPWLFIASFFFLLADAILGASRLRWRLTNQPATSF